MRQLVFAWSSSALFTNAIFDLVKQNVNKSFLVKKYIALWALSVDRISTCNILD